MDNMHDDRDMRKDDRCRDDKSSDGCDDKCCDNKRRIDKPPTPYVNVTYQICKIHQHPASDCCWRNKDDFNDDRDHEDKVVHAAAYGIDTNWYTDSSFTVHNKYQGQDHIHTANGYGMHVSHIGHSILQTPSNSLQLHNILHVLQKVFYLFINLHFTMTFLLSFIHISRIRTP
jgi:hypothetical protein